MSTKHANLTKISLVCLGISAALSPMQSYSAATENAEADEQVERIMVTSRKKEESIIEVPMSVSSVSAMEIVDRNYLNTQDLYRTLAGAAMPRGQLILRGLSGGNTANPDTTATFTDGVPFTFTNLSDIERVEVLRGPQGTLYGSNAIGGTVRVITKKPAMNEFELLGSLQAKSEKNVGGYDNNMSLGINLPLIDDTLALRVNGNLYNDQRPMVNAYTGNQSNKDGNFIRTQLLWQPADELAVNFGYVREEERTKGQTLGDRSKPGGYEKPILKPVSNAKYGYTFEGTEQISCVPNLERAACLLGGQQYVSSNPKYTLYNLIDGWSEDTTDLFTLAVDHDNLFDFATMSYVGSYREVTSEGLDDWSRLDMSDTMRTWIINDDFSERATHEIRFQNFNTKSPLNWTVGAFYDKTTEPKNPNVQWQYIDGGNYNAALFAAWIGVDGAAIGKEKFGNSTKIWNSARTLAWKKEFSLFADASYTIGTDNLGSFELNAGIRRYNIEDYSHTAEMGVWSNKDTITAGQEDGNRLKFSASWMPSDDMSVYALYSEGYRPGGNNGPLAQACKNDPKAGDRKDRYTSDKIDNYELGFKGSFFNGNVNFASAVYQIDWTDIKTSIYMDTCGFDYTANGGAARSQGIEFESTSQLTDDLKMVLNASYTSSELTEDNAAIGGKAGDNMTMVPEYNAYLALDQSVELFGKQAFIRADMTAYGDYKTHFDTLDADKVDAYQVFNLAGRVEVSDSVQLSVHINNLLDNDAVKYKRARSRSKTSTAQQYIEYLPERNITVRVDYSFF
jgi:outer membrane receptor protein involved in Fe transport